MSLARGGTYGKLRTHSARRKQSTGAGYDARPRGRDLVKAHAGLRLGVQTILVLGLLVPAGTWLFAGSFFGRRMQQIEEEAVDVSRRYTQAQALLSDTRSEVYRASIVVRDALLDPQPDPARYVADVENAYRQADNLLAQYVPVLGSRRNTSVRSG